MRAIDVFTVGVEAKDVVLALQLTHWFQLLTLFYLQTSEKAVTGKNALSFVEALLKR